MRVGSSIGVVGLLAGAAAPAHAQLTYLTQARSVFANVGYGTTSSNQTLTAPDFGTFDATAAGTVAYLGTDPAGSAATHQVSVLAPFGITDVSSIVDLRPAVAGTGYAEGESKLDVTFTADAASPFMLSGTMPAFVFNGPQTQARTVRLTGPGVNINLEGPGAFNQTGAFTAGGQYELLVDGLYAYNQITPTPGEPNFNVSLVVPEPATAGSLAAAALLLRRRRRA